MSADDSALQTGRMLSAMQQGTNGSDDGGGGGGSGGGMLPGFDQFSMPGLFTGDVTQFIEQSLISSDFGRCFFSFTTIPMGMFDKIINILDGSMFQGFKTPVITQTMNLPKGGLFSAKGQGH